jgi:serine/threonine-protein kinase
MKLDRDDWHTALGLLDEALSLAPGERDRWLGALPAAHLHLQPALRELLEDRRAIETADFLVMLPALGHTVRQAHERVGPWELLRPLGEGGMASVWLACRADGAHARDVALKLPHRRPGSRAFVERFLRERRILSTLDHPNIAPVLDAGSDGDQPWLALAYVEGQPITEAAAALDLRAKLRLFLPVLQAVQHAHAQLVIHRDIKPANVLVTADGRVQLLDFGVAKLLQPEGEGTDTELTRAEGRAMTLPYASPEQVAGRPLGVASDVYSLGVLLYEVLTGRRPHRPPRDSAAALEEAILGGQVQPPSQAVADDRQARALRGDIDTIAMKALALDPAARYSSAQAFADDIERHLAALPIAARPASLAYRLRRFVVRQRLAVGVGSLVVAAMATGTGVALWQADRARNEAARATAVQQFLVGLLQTTDPQQGRAHDLTARELLDLNVARIDSEFADRPALRGELLQTVAKLYVARGDAARGKPLLERAIPLLPEGEPRMAALMDRIDLANELEDLDDTRQAIAAAEAAAQPQSGSRHRWLPHLLLQRAWVAMNEGRLDDARRLADEALPLVAESTPDRARLLVGLGNIDLELGDLRGAAARFEAAQAAGGGRGELDRLTLAFNLARVRFNLGEYGAAQAQLERSLPRLDAIAGRSHDRTTMSRSLYAQTLAEQGRMDESVAELRANLAAVRARAAADSTDLALYGAFLARGLRQAGRADEALPLLRDALARIEAASPRPSTTSESVRRMLGEALLAAGQREAGIAALDTALGRLQAMGVRTAERNAPETALRLALALRDTPRAGEALPLATGACEAMVRQRPAESVPVLRCRAIQAWLAARAAPAAGHAAAVSAFATARERLFATNLPAAHPLRIELVGAEAELLQPFDAARAAELQAQAGVGYRRIFGREMPAPLLLVH